MKPKKVIQAGEIYLFSPFPYEYNPERCREPRVGLFLERIVDPSGWRQSRFKILGPQGVEELWSNRWAVDPIPQFIGEP